MNTVLAKLIQQARTELGSTACQAGRHTWGSEGGRPCPFDLTDRCSQAVYACIVCGTHDYGEWGGPGDQDCAGHCQHREARSIAILQARRDPFDFSKTAVHRNAKMYHRMLLGALRRQPKARLP